tara:strand:+ start:125 stop:1246 length:1122 start_codon:yes stop_codon:yes gene_type:complete
MNINSEVSKYILNNIIKQKKINFQKYDLDKYKKEIQKLKKDYKFISKKNSFNTKYKYYFFWELMRDKYNIKELTLKKRNQKQKSDKVNIEFSIFGKILGYNPSLLSMLIFEKEFKLLIKTHNFFEEIQEVCELENIKTKIKLNVIQSLSKGELEIITPLCPDYEHVSLGMGLYKYTFNKLNDGLGLIGKRLGKIIINFHNILSKHNIKFKHYLYYGDFEAYSDAIQKRLNISEDEFIKKLKKSSNKMKKKINNTAKVDLLVTKLSKKNIWLNKCKDNKKKIEKKYNKDVRFKILINEITASRSELYSSWFPGKREKDYANLVMQQGAEYTSMGDIFKKKFKNPLVLGLDHPKMADFYSLNVDIPVIYGKPKYV